MLLLFITDCLSLSNDACCFGDLMLVTPRLGVSLVHIPGIMRLKGCRLPKNNNMYVLSTRN